MEKSKIGIIGHGWVGKSMEQMFPDAVIYDEPQLIERHEGEARNAVIDAGRVAINGCDIAFICVPTPNLTGPECFTEASHFGRLNRSIVEDVVDWCEADTLVIRSTLNPGDADYLKEKTGKSIVTQPEYLGETVAHPLLDQGERPFIILGGEPADNRKVIEAYQGVYNANTNIRQVTNKEAEVIKLSENRAIAYKVAQCQELYDVCEAAGIDYYTVRDAVYGDDPRFNLWHTFVYPDARGMDSKCIPKDVLAWRAWAESVGVEPKVTRALLSKNEEWTGKPNA